MEGHPPWAPSLFRGPWKGWHLPTSPGFPPEPVVPSPGYLYRLPPLPSPTVLLGWSAFTSPDVPHLSPGLWTCYLLGLKCDFPTFSGYSFKVTRWVSPLLGSFFWNPSPNTMVSHSPSVLFFFPECLSPSAVIFMSFFLIRLGSFWEFTGTQWTVTSSVLVVTGDDGGDSEG